MSGGQPSNIIRMEPDPGLIKMDLSKGRESLSGGDQESAQRFGSEVKYVTYFAQRLAESLGMHQLQLGIIEDRNQQFLKAMRRPLDAGGAVIAVGAFHLPGDAGILAGLAAAGYRVERVQVAGEAP